MLFASCQDMFIAESCIADHFHTPGTGGIFSLSVASLPMEKSSSLSLSLSLPQFFISPITTIFSTTLLFIDSACSAFINKRRMGQGRGGKGRVECVVSCGNPGSFVCQSYIQMLKNIISIFSFFAEILCYKLKRYPITASIRN